MKENIRFEISWEQRHGTEFLWMNEYENRYKDLMPIRPVQKPFDSCINPKRKTDIQIDLCDQH